VKYRFFAVLDGIVAAGGKLRRSAMFIAPTLTKKAKLRRSGMGSVGDSSSEAGGGSSMPLLRSLAGNVPALWL